jgi:hypothetical protein
VTAVSDDGQMTSKTVTYTVVSPAVVSPTVVPPTVVSPDNRFKVIHVATRRNGRVIVTLGLPGPGTVNVLETAWLDNYATAATLLRPAPMRFVFARAHRDLIRGGTTKLTIDPNKSGSRLIAHHRYAVVIRLWLSYTPTDGTQRNSGIYGLHITHRKR